MKDLRKIRQAAGEAGILMRALSNERRLLILCHLAAEGETSVGDLAAVLELPQATLSQQLALLRKDGLVSTRREAQTIFYALNGEAARKVISVLYEIYCAD
jgi:DNA-binding transcriptional ArsR family regulator